jgi:hypothetical protein
VSEAQVAQLTAQATSVGGEIAKYQDAAKIAYQNYERELQMHAQAERELGELRRLLEVTKASLAQEQQRAATLSADCIRKEAQVSSAVNGLCVYVFMKVKYVAE